MPIPFPLKELVDAWNDVARRTRLRAQENPLDKERERKIEKAWRARPDFNYWRGVFARLGRSPFANGENDKGWRADIMFPFQRHKESRTPQHERIMAGVFDPPPPFSPPPLPNNPNQLRAAVSRFRPNNEKRAEIEWARAMEFARRYFRDLLHEEREPEFQGLDIVTQRAILALGGHEAFAEQAQDTHRLMFLRAAFCKQYEAERLALEAEIQREAGDAIVN